jgi:hypothetical protein
MKDIKEAGTPQELLNLLHDEALNPPKYGPLSENQKIVLASCVATYLWHLNRKYLKVLISAVDSLLFLGAKPKKGLNYKQVQAWPDTLQKLHEWVTRNWQWYKGKCLVGNGSDDFGDLLPKAQRW